MSKVFHLIHFSFQNAKLKDWRAMRTTLVTAVPLSFSWLLSEGEVKSFCRMTILIFGNVYDDFF